MSNPVNPLVIGKIIPDVIDPFMPCMSMSVTFQNKHVTNGCDIKPSMAVDPPVVTFDGNPNELYTLIMTDPDAPTPSEPSMREWIHWIVLDIPGGANPSRGAEIVPYMAPSPSVGVHRLVMILFKQKSRLGTVGPPINRANFNTRSFSEQLDLGPPAALVYFNSRREPQTRTT